MINQLYGAHGKALRADMLQAATPWTAESGSVAKYLPHKACLCK